MTVARKIVLPRLVVTEVSTIEAPGSQRIELPGGQDYFVQRIFQEETDSRMDGKPRWMGARFNLYPVVLAADGAPWAEANVYILSRLEESLDPSMSTYLGIADDLTAFRRFLDEEEIDWTSFPTHKLRRPTYRYNGYLRLAVADSKVGVTTAKRRMSSVIGFYNWLQSEGVLKLANPPWKSQDQFIGLKDTKGLAYLKKITTTDIGINVQKQNDPYAGTIDDGGALRPLTIEEQGWLMEALLAQGNTEMTLIHLFGLVTGARIQTVLTFRVRHAVLEFDDPNLSEIRFPVGPGTGVDTKNNKRMVLHIPRWFYEMLRTYALSERARRRRCRAEGGDTTDQYLFLSVRGAPLYQSKADAADFDEDNDLRHSKTGQGVRQFIAERIIPYIRKHYCSTFKYRFHDTRASFGMDLTDRQLSLVAQGEITLHEAREFVKVRMGHESAGTTDRYLQYRSNLKLVRQVVQDYAAHLRALSGQAMEGLK
ncbi:integrase [Crenobacter intestini]|uniref:Integrase n=1 Tax=Crenobacter intestini TaxID=2563443 RepID=A0A4T0UTH4_9NEIS|nr:integrase [Crenobacter intestini]TIC82270.1 integrase [Crenobacter intestini]